MTEEIKSIQQPELVAINNDKYIVKFPFLGIPVSMNKEFFERYSADDCGKQNRRNSRQ